MSVMLKLASSLGTNSEVPNQEVAKQLAGTCDAEAIAEIAAGLGSYDMAVQSDCIKVLYEIGYLKPALISVYAESFLNLLQSRNNRIVWGAMIALSTIAGLAYEEISKRKNLVYMAMENGSVITMDNGIRVLALVAANNHDNNTEIVEYLLRHLKTCRPKEVPQHAESSLPAINAGNKGAFLAILKSREEVMSPAQMKRMKKIYKIVENK